MNLASLSIKRPVFVSCIVILMLCLGYLSMKRLPVDLFPNVTFPVVMVNTVYRGAGPEEVETLVSKVLEDEVSTLPGIKSLKSQNREGYSLVIAEFTLETDIKVAEQQIRDRVGSAKRKLPKDIDEPIIRRVDPADQPIMILAVSADLPEAKLYDLADQVIKTKIQQVNQVGNIDVAGGRKREIRVELDRKKLKEFEVSATQVSTRIAAAGVNVPAGKVDEGSKETTFRSLGEFKTLKDIEKTIVNFIGNDVPVTVADVGSVHDTLVDEKTRAFVNGKKSLFLLVYRQSGANTVSVTDGVRAMIEKVNKDLATQPGAAKVTIVRDGAKMIRANLDDVRESIMIGIALTILVVFFFLGSGRSTLITGLALPNSLIGAFLLMAAAGFTVNVMTLLALSLAVGLLIDDAIVVRENIFRHNEHGKDPITAALDGTKEVTLAVIATTLTVIAVFASIGFLKGVVGQFFKEFGLTICFAMAISLFDAMTMAPMLSAYFAGASGRMAASKGFFGQTLGRAVQAFDRFQDWLEAGYVRVLRFTLRRPRTIIFGAFGIFVVSMVAFVLVPKQFMQAADAGEFMTTLELPPGTSMDGTNELANKVDALLRAHPEVERAVMFIGGSSGQSNAVTFFVELVPSKKRNVMTSQFKDVIRKELKPFAYARPIVKDVDIIMGGMRAFNVNIVGTDLKEIEKYSALAYERLKNHPGLLDVDFSFRPGKPEFQVVLDNLRAERMGVSTAIVGGELRNLIDGTTPALFRENGYEYDIRVRLRDDQRNLREGFNQTYVPNINFAQVRLSDVAKPVQTTGPANIDRQDRGRYYQISADMAPKGPGMGAVLADVHKMFATDLKLPPGMRYVLVGQAETFKELGENMVLAGVLGILFIFLVLASLYESFVTPFAIMLVLPLAVCGAFLGLFITRTPLDLFSMIGCIMLLGVATKNSILLVDYTNQLIEKGMDQSSALIQAGKTRLRPILMTTGALIAGMLPVAIGLNEASRQRTSMGIGVIGGLVSSTLLTLVVVPASYSYIERFRVWSSSVIKRWVSPKRRKARAEVETDDELEPTPTSGRAPEAVQ